jgi:hypothetical protein
VSGKLFVQSGTTRFTTGAKGTSIQTKKMLARDKPAMKGFPENGPFGLPAEFLISLERKTIWS